MSNTGNKVEPAMRFLCPVCGYNGSMKSLPEHIAEYHLGTRCLQIAYCSNTTKGCSYKKDIFSVSFLTEHFTKCNQLHYPSTACKHRNNCQTLFDKLLNDSVCRLGPVDRNGKSSSTDPDTLRRIDKLVKLHEYPKARPEHACFVKALQENNRNRAPGYVQSRSSTYDCGNAGNGGGRCHSPGYGGRSPGYTGERSPGYGGRSPGYGGRSPGYAGDRSPGYGGRSPGYGGRSPGYAGDRSPGYGGRSPGYAGDRSPGYGGRSPGYARDRSPGYGGRSPGYGERNRSPAPTGSCTIMDRSPVTIGNRSPGYFETEQRSDPLLPPRRDSWSSQMDGSSHSSSSLVTQGISFRKEIKAIVKKEPSESMKNASPSSRGSKMSDVHNIPSASNTMNNRLATMAPRPTINIQPAFDPSRNILDASQIAPSSSRNAVSSSQGSTSLPCGGSILGYSNLGNLSELTGRSFANQSNNYPRPTLSSYSNRNPRSNNRPPQPQTRSLFDDEGDCSKAKRFRDERSKRH